jgi:Protein of unknown function (DUF3892)
MADRQVTCVSRLTLPFPHIRGAIAELGGEGWRMSRGQVVHAINAGQDTFYTDVDGKRADVRVRTGSLFLPDYVQTEADGQWTNNLLALPNCGGRCDVRSTHKRMPWQREGYKQSKNIENSRKSRKRL